MSLLNTTVVSGDIILTIGGADASTGESTPETRLLIEKVTMTFAANGVNAAQVDLATGQDINGRVIDLSVLRRGVRAIVRLTRASQQTDRALRFGQFREVYGSERYLFDGVLFDGVVEDFYPSVVFGDFHIRLHLSGLLTRLATGTLQSNTTVPSSYLDTGVAWNTIHGPQARNQISEAVAAEDFWTALQRCLLEIATDTNAPSDSLTSLIQNEFGTDSNQLAAGVLSRITAPVGLRIRPVEGGESILAGFVDSFNALFGANWAYESFMSRIVKIGGMMRFAIVESGSSIQIIPWIPCARSDSAKQLDPGTYQVVQSNLIPYRQYRGCLLTAGGSKDAQSGKAADLRVGLYRRRGNPTGQVHVATAPEFMTALGTSQLNDSDGSSRAYTAQLGDIGDELAKAFCWEQMYGPRKMRVVCPFLRTDIGPLSQIKLPFPKSIPAISKAIENPGIYGMVEQVTIQVDCSAASASTSIDLGFVRSYDQQAEIDTDFTGHPYWSSYFIQGPLGTSTGIATV